jgi:hypothetical protein
LPANLSKSEHDSEKETRKFILERIVLYTTLFGTVVSFLIGDLLGENSTGSSRPDFEGAHWKAIQLFSERSWGEAITSYPSATTPLLYMIASLLPLHGNKEIYHAITFTISLLIWPLLSWAYYRRYAKYGIDWLWASFGASTVLLSPSFRPSAFWGDTDYLPLLFCAATSLLLSRIQDFKCAKAPAVGAHTVVALFMVSAAAFYVRQYYAFLPVFAAWTLLTRTETPLLLVLVVFATAMIPEVFLVYLWKGLNPPTFNKFHPAMINVLIVGAIIGLLSTPLVVGCIRRSLGDVLPEWWGGRSTVVAFAGLLVFIMALGATEWPGAGWGGGIIVKAGLRMGALGTPFILSVSYFGLVAAIVFAMGSATNALLAGAFLAPYLVSVIIYQHYLEPSLTVALFLFADTQTARTVFNKRVLTCNFLFTALILAAGIVYYDLGLIPP